MRDFRVNKSNLTGFIKMIIQESESTGAMIITTQPAAIGEWGMARLWRKWMSTTHEVMAGNKIRTPIFNDDGEFIDDRPISKQDVYELFTKRWLGTDNYGTRLSWAQKDHDGMRAATKGERYFCMLRHEEWATSCGIELFKPRGNEYTQLDEQQNE